MNPIKVKICVLKPFVIIKVLHTYLECQFNALSNVISITIGLLTKLKLTMSVIIMGRPYEISFVDSMRMTVRLMVIRTTPPRKAAAPIKAKVPE